MSIYSNIILVSDLDDTLLNKNKEISESDINSINKFIENGGNFAVATGRVYESAMPYIKKLNITHPCIMFNGGMIYDTCKNEVLWKCCLPINAKDYVNDVLDNFPEVAAEILVDKEIYIPRMNKILEEKMELEHVSYISCLLDDIPSEWIKVLFTLEHSLIPEVAEFVNSRNYEGVSFVESCGCYYEMLPKGVSKGEAIKTMLEITKDKDKGMKVVAVGDYNNDIEMIEMADMGVCVANAVEDVKMVADVILKSTSEQSAITELIQFVIKNGGKINGFNNKNKTYSYSL